MGTMNWHPLLLSLPSLAMLARRPRPAALAQRNRPGRPNRQSWPAWNLDIGQDVQLLPVARGEQLQLQATEGRIWLTCEDCPQDIFLEPGTAPWMINGPARLRVSAEGQANARLYGLHRRTGSTNRP